MNVFQNEIKILLGREGPLPSEKLVFEGAFGVVAQLGL